MSWSKTVILATVAGLLAGLASWIMSRIYATAFYTDFSAIIGPLSLFASCIFGTTLMSLGHRLIHKWNKPALIPWMNVLYAIVSYLSILGVLGFNLPLEIESPELFPGMVLPMHFFPLLSFLVIKSFFKQETPEESVR